MIFNNFKNYLIWYQLQYSIEIDIYSQNFSALLIFEEKVTLQIG